ncbi:ParB/RepB/Spo0J family partition protein [Sphingobium sp. CR28]|uniref:ParB/RepB/Spo0J family partition protein n=1 Tax=Sphingobium sp. CR28 TaxID=3400272 RepID=UPI003FEF88DD
MSEDNGAGAKAPPRRSLGRGLSALFEETRESVSLSGESAKPDETGESRIQILDIVRIAPHQDQPRRHFDEAALAELADSISTRGIIQPIVVRPTASGYQIVAGERRWRAAQKAQLHRIPAIVRDFDEAETLEIALVENIQREDLNPIEEAQAYKRLIGQFGHSQEALGRLVGKSRSHVANLMRLLDLPSAIQTRIFAGEISMGHGRALIGVPGAEMIADEIVRRGLSVRDTERLVRRARSGENRSERPQPVQSDSEADVDIAALERKVSDMLGLKAQISDKNGAGTLTLHYSNLGQLDLVIERLHGDGF